MPFMQKQRRGQDLFHSQERRQMEVSTQRANQGLSTMTPPAQKSTNPTGKGGSLGLLSQRLVQGIRNRKKKAQTQQAQSQQGITSQVLSNKEAPAADLFIQKLRTQNLRRGVGPRQAGRSTRPRRA